MPVAAGSIAFVAFSFDNWNTAGNSQGFAFVALDPIAAGEQIRFVDGGWNGTALAVDSQVVWTNGAAALPAGSIVQVTFGGNSSNDLYTTATVNVGAVTAPRASDGTAAATWNIDTTDSLYAVSTTTGTAPGTFAAAVLWGNKTATAISSGATLYNPGTAATSNDTAVINAATANASFANAAAARTAYTNTANWLADADSSDNTGTTAAPDWPALSDSNSPLNGKAALTVASPSFSFGDANALVNNAESTATLVTISGLGSGATAVATFKSSGGTATVTGSFSANGAVNVNLSGLPDGAITITKVDVTNAGTTTSFANPTAGNPVALDKAAPNSPAITGVSDDAGSVTGTVASGASTDDTTPTVAVSLSGANAAAGDTVKLLAGGTQVASKVLTASDITAGTVSLTSAALSGDGAKSLTATVTDAAGNVSAASASRSMVLDTGSPSAPAIGTVADNVGATQGALANGATTDDNTLALTGTAEAGSAVKVFNGAAQVATATADGSGNWTATTAVLGDGPVSLTATATDAAGNASGASTARTATVDSAAPTVSAVAYDANDGALAAGETVNLTVAFSEAVTVAGGTPSLALSSGGSATYVSGSGSGTLVFAYTPAAGQTAVDLAVTGFNLNGATVKDAAGNAANTAAAVANPAGILAVDTTAAAVTSIAATGTGITGGNGAVKAGDTVTLTVSTGEAVTVTGTPTLALSGGATATYDAANSTPTALKFTYTVAAGQNAADLAVTAINGTIKDAAGNSLAFDSAATGNPAGTLVVDTTPPTATTTVGLVADTGAAGDGISSNPALSGTSSSGVAGETVTILDNGVAVGTATTGAGGAWTFANGAAADGTHAYTAAVTDAAGNRGAAAATTPATTTVDTTPPTATATIRLVSDTGSSAADGITANPALSGNGPANATLVVKDGATVVGTATAAANGAWTFANAGAADGSHSYTVQVADAAGNLGPASGAVAVTLDKAAPAATTTVGLVADTGAAGDGISSNPALSGTSSSGVAGETVTILDNGVAVGTATTGTGGAWTFANAAAADGAHSYTAAVTDAAGNRGASSATTPAGTTVDTQADTGVVVDLRDAAATANSASVDLTISGLDGGSKAVVTFQGGGGGSVVREFTANGDQTADISGLRGDVSATVSVFDAAGNLVQGAGGTLSGDPVCFMPGTLVATPSGEVAVETLAAGDLVLTADGGAAPVRWLGRQTVSTRFADPLRVLPVRIAAGALGENLPKRDLLVSADHALLLDGALVQAGALVNGATVRREARVPEVFTYFHVELADHALVLAEGVPAESFIDNVARMAFDNWAEHGAAADPAPIAELALPRAKSARQVPQATRRRLAERATSSRETRTEAA